MPLSEDSVREALKQVIDPELFVNIIDLGLVYSVVVEPAGEANPGKEIVKIEMTMTSPACPAGPQLIVGSAIRQQHWMMRARNIQRCGEANPEVPVRPWR